MTKRIFVAAAAVALGGCALKGDVRRVEQQIAELRADAARADSSESTRADELNARIDALVLLQRAVLDSIDGIERRLTGFVGENRNDHTEIERQLVQIQELTGQSQQRLSELGQRLNQREAQAEAPVVANPTDSNAVVGSAEARDIYDIALQQLRRSSVVTARDGFIAILNNFPDDPLVPDARFMLGEAWAGSNPDSAAAAYAQVANDYPDSPRAPTALFKLGRIAQRQGKTEEARRFYQRIIAGYPNSDEAALAQSQLNSFNP